PSLGDAQEAAALASYDAQRARGAPRREHRARGAGALPRQELSRSLERRRVRRVPESEAGPPRATVSRAGRLGAPRRGAFAVATAREREWHGAQESVDIASHPDTQTAPVVFGHTLLEHAQYGLPKVPSGSVVFDAAEIPSRKELF